MSEIKLWYEIVKVIEIAAEGRDLTDAEFEGISICQDEIFDAELRYSGEMHPRHTGTVGDRFRDLDQSNL